MKPVVWDLSRLDQVCRKARNLDGPGAPPRVRFGEMSPWWLTDAALRVDAGATCAETLAQAVARTAAEGAVFCLVRWSDSIRECLPIGTLLRAAFPLPVRFEPGKEDDPLLPDGFRRMARSVRGEIGIEGFGLRLALGGHPVSLAGLDISADSAWATLAAGLRLARDRHPPRPDVVVSARFEPETGFEAVTGIEDKLELAQAMGAKVFFVAAANRAEVARLHDSDRFADIEISTLTPWRDANAALEPLLAVLELPPRGGHVPLENRIRYHRQLLAHRPAEAQMYYRSELLDDLLEAATRRSSPAADRNAALLTFLSTNPECALFAVHAIRPGACLVLHTKESAPEETERSAAVFDRIQALCPETRKVCIEQPLHVGARSEAERFARDHASVPLRIDVTPGPKHVMVAVLTALAGQKPAVYYLEQGADGDSRRVGEERLIRLDSDAPTPMQQAPVPAGGSGYD